MVFEEEWSRAVNIAAKLVTDTRRLLAPSNSFNSVITATRLRF